MRLFPLISTFSAETSEKLFPILDQVFYGFRPLRTRDDSKLIQNQRFRLGLAFAMVEGGLNVLSDYATISHCYRVQAGVSRFGNNFESFYQLKAKKKPSKS